jgi:hypothetical protein
MLLIDTLSSTTALDSIGTQTMRAVVKMLKKVICVRGYYDQSELSKQKLRPTSSSHKNEQLLSTTLHQLLLLPRRKIMNLTMKNAFLLLTLFVGAVDGTYFDAEVQGQDIDADYFCTMDTYNELYEDCIVTIAENHGVVFDRRRLELRGSRGLQSCSVCPPNPPKGHWCWVKCGYATRRSLQVGNGNASDQGNENASDNADTTIQGLIQEAATECYKAKSATTEYSCLGDADELLVGIDYQE